MCRKEKYVFHRTSLPVVFQTSKSACKNCKPLILMKKLIRQHKLLHDIKCYASPVAKINLYVQTRTRRRIERPDCVCLRYTKPLLSARKYRFAKQYLLRQAYADLSPRLVPVVVGTFSPAEATIVAVFKCIPSTIKLGREEACLRRSATHKVLDQ